MSPAGLWLPENARRELGLIGGKTYSCRLCGKRYPDTQRRAWMQHVVTCSKRNEEITEQHVEMRRSSAFTGGGGDEERFRYEREVAAGVREPRRRGSGKRA